jgi:hypothetical protein
MRVPIKEQQPEGVVFLKTTRIKKWRCVNILVYAHIMNQSTPLFRGKYLFPESGMCIVLSGCFKPKI